jgi:hypothetical protein
MDFKEAYLRQHMEAVQAGARGQTGEVKPEKTFLGLTEVPDVLKKAVQKSNKAKKSTKSKPKSTKPTPKPKAKGLAAKSGQNGPPPKTALQKKLLKIGWDRWENRRGDWS